MRVPRGIFLRATTWTLPSISCFLVLVRHRGGGPVQLPRCINPACEATGGKLGGQNPAVKVPAKQRSNRISCVAVLIAPFLRGGRARANVGPYAMPQQQVGLLILPPYHIAQVFLSPLDALASHVTLEWCTGSSCRITCIGCSGG
jgi:hypothetical protein